MKTDEGSWDIALVLQVWYKFVYNLNIFKIIHRYKTFKKVKKKKIQAV